MDRRQMALRQAQKRLESPEIRNLAVELSVLLPLPLWEERDLYGLLERDVRELTGLTGLIDFPALRLQARGTTLDEVYDDLSARVMGVNVRAVAERERALRIRLPVLMQDVHSLLQLARKRSKRVIIYQQPPDWLTAADAAQMLAERGVDMPDALYIGKWDAEIMAADTLRLAEGSRQLENGIALPAAVQKCATKRLCAGQRSFLLSGEAMRFAGIRAIQAMAALPPVRQDAGQVGYAMLGPYLFSHAVWLAQEMRRGGFDRMVFLARDGYWVKRAYDLVAPALGVHVPSAYVRISRRAAFPLHFRQRQDLLSLPVLVDMTAHTPRTLTELLAPVIDAEAAEAVLKQHGFAMDERLHADAAARFVQIAADRLFSQQRAEECRARAKAYLEPIFTGKCATFDVGYNLRSESVIREVTGADVTAFITHTDSDVPDRRGVPYRTLYPSSPYVSWVAREQFLLEDAPLCVGYDENGPVLAAEAANVHPEIRRCQHAALAFVADMVRAYGDRLAVLPFRPADGCAAFEQFLHRGPYRLMKPFRQSCVENAFHAGAAGEDGAFLQWRLMQTDLQSALGAPRWLIRLRRAAIRLREAPRSFLAKCRAIRVG